MRRWLVLTIVLVFVAAACASGDDAGNRDDGASLGDTTPASAITAPPLPEEAAPGTGVIEVSGGTTSSFAITGCKLAADPAEPPGAQTLVLITGTGTTDSGVGFSIEIQRFATGTDVRTFTDTISYSDPARILQAQRIEVNGQVSDLRDPDAVSPMIRTRSDGVSASGVAGPPGEGEGADGTVGFAVDATCAF